MQQRFIWLAVLLIAVLSVTSVFGQRPQPKKDTTLRFPIKDRRGDPYTWQNRNPFDIRDTSYIKQTIEYDPVTRQYYIIEKIGNQVYRRPTYLTFEEFYKLRAQQQEAEYFRKRANALAVLNRKVERPKFKLFNNLFNRIMGADSTGKVKIDIRPQGNVDIMAGYQGQNIKNPTLPERARKSGGFDFDMNANLNVIANIGEKLKLPINYNTLANFDFENQLKLDYKGLDDEIIKSIEAGNINWQSKGTLIPSTQGLFGLKTQLQFGKLFITSAIANQKSTRQSVALQGGAATTQFQKRLDEYEENRHFLLAGYFRENYNKAMSQLPRVNSQVQVLRMEVWVTNRTGATTDARDVVGLTQLGELTTGGITALPYNEATPLYRSIINNPNARNPSQATSMLLGLGLKPVTDFEKTFARKLNANEYYFNPQVGWISLNQQLQPDEVLAVAYQYTYNGKVYQVGEFSQDVALDTTRKNGVQQVLYLKLLKATSQRSGSLLWNLMMKNVYSLDVASIQPQDFKLNIMYEEPSKGLKRYLPESDPAVEGVPLLRVLRLDRLNNRLDPQPDGVFDYIEGFTVLSQQGKIVFPVLEPFGRDLEALAFTTIAPAIKNKYLYTELYDSIKAIAQTYANKNRYLFQGQVKGAGGSEIYLGAFNVPQGSVSVTAGGQILTENVDYTVDYNLGSVKIINQGILNSGVPVNVQFENNAGFGIQQKNFMGLRLDYLASKNLSIGASMVRLSERPFFTKMSYGEDPIRNTMYGVDFSYRSSWPSMTRWLDKLPFYTTTAASNITAYGEAAYLKPGHAPQIGKGGEGLIYLDDFEGSKNSIDLRFPWVAWTLASTPSSFPEGSLFNDTTYGINRAKLAWYNIEPILQDRSSSNNPLRNNRNELSDPRVRLVNTTELFPQRTPNLGQSQTVTFDMAYYPAERGPYNFETRSSVLGPDGKFRPGQRKKNWGGIMRAIDQTDFETGNVEFIEFWIQDPFYKTSATNGKLVINLGNISEDVLKDGKRFYENGLPTPKIPAQIDSSVWGYQPINPIQITQAFSNDPDDRPFQDVGFDGMSDANEVRRHSNYLASLAATFGTASAIYQQALADPSNDNYLWYREQLFDQAGTGILGRYKNYNNPQGNSPVANTSSEFSSAATLYPDNEDLNRDNTLNENEEYYEYEINLAQNMPIGSYVVDKRIIGVNYANGTPGNETWYQLRVPVKGFTRKIGNIPDFKSIRFIRMYLTDFDDSVVMRFASLDLVRNQWRTFTYGLDTAGRYNPASSTPLLVSAVNIEENSKRSPVNYVIPCGIERVEYLSNNNVNLLQNEQAMSLQVRNLGPHDSKAVFKTLNLDLRQYGQLSMFIHAESVTGQPTLLNDQLYAVVRIGQDFLSNYYEIRWPLKVTKPGFYSGNTACDTVWPTLNNLDFSIQDLIALKTRRNGSVFPVTQGYHEQIGNKTFTVYGNPNLGEVRGFLVGIDNPNNDPVSAELWINELRLSKMDESGGYAALGRVDVQLADLGTLTVSANTYTKGFGTIEQRVNERARDNLFQFDAAANLDAGKLLPKQARLTIPVYASINKTIRTPEYDPYDLDIKLKDKMNAYSGKKDSIRSAAIDETTIKTLNFTNVRIQPKGKPKLWSISNLDVSYSYTKFQQTNPIILKNDITKHRGGLGYTYNSAPVFIEPLKKMRNKSPWFALVRDFNFNINPSLLSFRADINRQFGEFVPRIVSEGKIDRVDTTYDKYFTFDRFYNLRWDLTRSLNIDFSATNNARVDEPYGRIDTKAKKDSVKENFWNGGRNTLYTQRAVAAYTLPLSKIPLTDWITARYSYSTTYSWIGASRLAIDLGNTIENSQDHSINGEFDFTRLYQKSRWLRALDVPSQPKVKDEKGDKGKKPATKPQGTNVPPVPKREDVVKGLTGKARKDALERWREQKRAARMAKANQPVEMGGFLKGTGKFITMLKRTSVNYSENFRSRLPGYMDSTRFLGQNWNSMAPGLDYVFGKQPDTSWLNKQAAKGLITRSKDFNFLFAQRFEQKLSVTAQLEPIRELLIDVNLDKSYSKDYSELFKDTSSTTTDQFRHNNPLSAGGFNVSFIAFKTLFNKFKPNEISETFQQFQEYRSVISQRLGKLNPYGSGGVNNGYAEGYGRYSQDVLIPAFIAAYTGKNPNDVALLKNSNPNVKANPFKGIMPRPNWKLTYTGLSRIPTLAKLFSTFSITHGYTGNLSMNSFTSALLFQDRFARGFPSFKDTISGNYVPYFLVPNITIQEQFTPLIGVDVTTNSQMNIRAEYKKSRQLSLSLIDYQLSEVNSTEWTFGFSWRKRGFNLPFKLPFMKDKKLENDINFRLDLSMRDDAQSNSRLDQANAYSTGGQKVITIQPSIDYVLNNRLNLKLFFDQRRVTPYISTSAPIVNTRAGLQLRIALAQ
jgi:cell surface protein SprA